MIDTDGSGAVDALELRAVFTALGDRVTLEDVQSMLAEVDRDSSGSISFAEFVEIMTL
eukprot:jgi/Astpho2/6516/gw1.00099.57.1_t